jgi:hypothetical protein
VPASFERQHCGACDPGHGGGASVAPLWRTSDQFVLLKLRDDELDAPSGGTNDSVPLFALLVLTDWVMELRMLTDWPFD